ncbi:uncharacterized protein LOC144149124 [Haemaphysalis longicornis]
MQTEKQTSDAGVTTTDDTGGPSNSAGTGGADNATSGACNSKQRRPMSESARVMRTAIRGLRLRLDTVGRRVTDLNYDNQTLTNRLKFLRCENARLHQALDKERAKLRAFLVDSSAAAAGADTNGPGGADGVVASGGSPEDASLLPTAALLPAVRSGPLTAASTADANTSTSVEQEAWPRPTAQRGRSSLLADAMNTSTSSASLDALLPHRRRLSPPPPLLPLSPQQSSPVPVSVPPPPPPPPLPPPRSATPSAPVLGLNRGTQSTASIQDASAGPFFFMFTDIFEDGSSEESTSANAARDENAASSETMPSTSAAVKQVSSDTAVARSDAPATAPSMTQGDPEAPGTSQDSPKRGRTKSGTTARFGSSLQDAEDKYEPKYSLSSSSLN